MSKVKFNAAFSSALVKLNEDIDSSRKKKYEKLFVSIDKNSNLKDSLNKYTKEELNDIRQSLRLSGVSSLKKAELIEVLDSNIKALLPTIVKKFTEVEYKVLIKIIKNNGYLKFKPEYLKIILYFRKYGILSTLLDENKEKYIAIPKDILEDLALLLNRVDILSEIKFNDKINRLSKGLLFFYGVLNHFYMQNKIECYFKNSINPIAISDILFENLKKQYGLSLQNSYWCSEFVENYAEVVDEQKRRPSIDFYPLSIEEALAAGTDGFREWNNYDKRFYNFLVDNFNISKADGENFIDEIKLEFKNGNSINKIIDIINSHFQFSSLSQLQTTASLVQDMYNHSRQWYLKGYSPNDIHIRQVSPVNNIPKAPLQSKCKEKIGRNDLCPCNSGKKYKNCCLNKN